MVLLMMKQIRTYSVIFKYIAQLISFFMCIWICTWMMFFLMLIWERVSSSAKESVILTQCLLQRNMEVFMEKLTCLVLITLKLTNCNDRCMQPSCISNVTKSIIRWVSASLSHSPNANTNTAVPIPYEQWKNTSVSVRGLINQILSHIVPTSCIRQCTQCTYIGDYVPQ